MALSEAAKKVRSKGVGSSEIAMLIYVKDDDGNSVPLSPWGGAHKLWRRKTGKERDKAAESYMTRGSFMENGLMDWYCHDKGVVWIKPKTITHPEYPHVVDSCDGLVFPEGTTKKMMQAYLSHGEGEMPLYPLEAKTSNFMKRDEWGADGSDDVPLYYLVQCIWHMGAHPTQQNRCVMPMDNGMKRSDYTIPFDEELYLSLVDRVGKFWRDYVEKDREPPVDDYGDANDWLSQWTKNKDGFGVLEASDEQVALMLQYREKALNIKTTETEMDELRHTMELAIGEYDGLIIPDTKQKILWKRSKDGTKTNWEMVAAELHRKLTILSLQDKDGHPHVAKDYDELKSSHSTVREGSRRWTPTNLIKNG